MQAIELYQQMRRSSVKPNGHVFAAALQACASLVDMYAKCGSLDDARRVFDGVPQKDVVTWNAMIGGYSQKGMGEEPLRLYSAVQEGGVTAPNSVTFMCLLQACASCVGIPALENGMRKCGQLSFGGGEADSCKN